jgi:molecular chaperone GrpE
MVYKELMKTLKDEGLKEIEAEGKPFDPKYHHGVAIGNEEDVDDQVVLDVFQKGYMYKDKVIRAAMVRINQK